MSLTLSPQLSVPSAELTVTDLGLAPEDKSPLPDDMIDICKVEPDADLDDLRAGSLVVNTVPSATSVPLTSPTSSSSTHPPVVPTLPSTPIMPSQRPFYPSPPQYLSYHHRRDEVHLPPPSLHPPPNPKPKVSQGRISR